MKGLYSAFSSVSTTNGFGLPTRNFLNLDSSKSICKENKQILAKSELLCKTVMSTLSKL